MKLSTRLAYALLGFIPLTVITDLVEKRLTDGYGLGKDMAPIDAVFVRLLWAAVGIAVFQMIMPIVRAIRERRNASSL